MAFDLFAKRLAHRAGVAEVGDVSQLDTLLATLFACDLPYCDPEGEPTLVQIALQELDRKFGKG